jgi:hypothetical protein
MSEQGERRSEQTANCGTNSVNVKAVFESKLDIGKGNRRDIMVLSGPSKFLNLRERGNADSGERLDE